MNLKDKTLIDLKKLAKTKGKKGYSKLNKIQLIQLLSKSGRRSKNTSASTRDQAIAKSKSIKEMRKACKDNDLVYDLKTKKCRERGGKSTLKSKSRRVRVDRRGGKSTLKSKSRRVRVDRKVGKSIKEMRKACKDKDLVYDLKTKKCRERGGKSTLKRKSKTISPMRPHRAVGECIERSCLSLKDYQKNVVKYMKNHDGLLVVHGTGWGKTLTAVTVSQCFLDENPLRKVIFVGPASLLINFEKELRNYGVTDFSHYELYSYDMFMNRMKRGDAVSCKHNLLIVDEVHNLRNTVYKSGAQPKQRSRRSRVKTPVVPQGKEMRRYKAVMDCAMQAKKRLLLTATPIVNNIRDFIPLVNFVYGARILGTTKLKKAGLAKIGLGKNWEDKNVDKIADLLDKRVDYLPNKKSDNFPIFTEEFVIVRMTPQYYNVYKRLIIAERMQSMKFTNPEKFYHGHRRAVNVAGDAYFCLKLEKMKDIILNTKTIIYSNWIEFGLKPVERFLKNNNIKFGLFSGQISKANKNRLVNEFNRGDINVLVITKAGGEGIDLKGVRSVIILDPVWHQAGMEQIIGRAVRFKSHTHLPENMRRVNVYKMVLVEPKNIIPELDNWRDAMRKSGSGDVILYEIIDKKKDITEKSNKLLQELSIEKNSDSYLRKKKVQ